MTIFLIIAIGVLTLITIFIAVSTNDNMATGPAWASATKWVTVALILALCFSIAVDRGAIG